MEPDPGRTVYREFQKTALDPEAVRMAVKLAELARQLALLGMIGKGRAPREEPTA